MRVPVANRLGDENDGWRVTMTTLASSAARLSSVKCSSPWSCCGACDTDRAAAPVRGTRRPCAAGVGHLGAELDALWALARRNVSQAARTGVPGIGGSVYKLALSELRQRIADLGMDLVGRSG